jgi:ribose transport system permease protein
MALPSAPDGPDVLGGAAPATSAGPAVGSDPDTSSPVPAASADGRPAEPGSPSDAAPAGAPTGAGRPEAGNAPGVDLARLLRRFGEGGWSTALPAVALVAIFLVFGGLKPAFFSVASLQNIMRQGAFLVVLSLAGTMAMLTGAIDLSVAANATLSGILVAKLTDHVGTGGAIVVALVACGVVGLVNAGVVSALRVPSFLVTLGMLSVLDGVSNELSGGAPISFHTQTLSTLVNSEGIPGVPNAAVIALVVVGLMTLVTFRTRLGRSIVAIGGNERAATLAGVPVARVKLYAFVLGGIMAGLAGVVFTGQALNGVPEGADPSLLASIAAIVVGGTSLSGGVGGPHRTLLGALVIVVLTSGMQIMAINPYVESMVYGGVVIAAVAVSIDRRRYGLIK